MVTQKDQEWVLLSYRLPREPSTPRIAVWRKLKELGVVQVGDGLVALPHDARNRERLEWVASSVVEAAGDAVVWKATPSTRRYSRMLANQMSEARAAEYADLIAEVGATTEVGRRTLNRLRRRWNNIDRRDYFRAPKRDEALIAIRELATRAEIEATTP